MGLDAVNHMPISLEEVHDVASPLVPHKDTPTVTPTHHPAVTKEVSLLDLQAAAEDDRDTQHAGKCTLRNGN